MISSVEKVYVDGNFDNIYKVTFSNGKISNVPHDTENTDYQAILDWVAAGNTITDPGA